MKKFISLLFIFLYLSFNTMLIPSFAQITRIKEGLYKASDFNITYDNSYEIQNSSSTDNSFILILNTDNIVEQSIKLEPNSEKYRLYPLKPEYTILIVGNGSISISKI